MKRFLFSLSFVMFGLSQIFAQNTVKKWYLGVGTFAVDHTSVRGVGDGFFDVDDYSATPFGKLTIGRNLNRSFAIDLQAAVGEVDNKRLYLKDEFMTLITLGLKYKLANGYILKERSWFDPYLRVSGGYHSFDYDSYTFNGVVDSENDALWGGNVLNRDNPVVTGGVGMNFWITENFGLNIESQYVHAFKVKTDYIDFFQHSAALAFRFGPNDKDKDGILDKDDECPDTFGLKEFNGCPDTDGDGVEDRKDDCVETPGPIANNGCPYPENPDTDGDGWLDIDEECDLAPCKDGEDTDLYYCFKGCKVLKPQKEAPIKITFEDVLFDFDKATLKGTAEEKVQQAHDIITQTDKNFIVTGHTDNYGTDEYNINLGKKRAENVTKALVAKGIDANRLTIKSAGESDPKCTNDTSEGRQCNRRVEIISEDGDNTIIIEVN